jgi:hypothetical protein
MAPTFAWPVCKIETSAIPELSQYIKSVDTRIGEIKKQNSTKNNCGITGAGPSANAEKTIETIDRASLEIPIFGNMFTDFLYNIRLAASWEKRLPVTRDGQIFDQIENKITSAIAQTANSCNLSDEAKSSFTDLLKENNKLENVFKETALGNPPEIRDLSSSGMIIAQAISLAYTPNATESCVDKSEKSVDSIVNKFNQALEFGGKKNESGLKEWNKAIALFRWGGSKQSIEERSAIWRKLLQEELSRQWFSPRAAQAMLANYDCVKARAAWDTTVWTMVQSQQLCLSNPILGLEKITLLPQRRAVQNALTTDDRAQRVNELINQEKVVKEIELMYSNLQVQKNYSIDTKTALMSNLIDIHLGILSTIEEINNRIKVMYKNCMKWNPDISCQKP